MRTSGILQRLRSPKGVLLLVALLACVAGTILLINFALTMLGNGLAQQASATPLLTSTSMTTPATSPSPSPE
jgi:hypothetical protein